ncbi:MAG TPA: C-GCAxxG-C-C family protein [bacterium]|nr:C-GCAxxG-C-C family protein [bacterium]
MDVDATVKKAGALAREYEKTCTGCAQSVVAGLMDALEAGNDDVFRAASGLADGIGLTGDGSCGALTGAALVIGLLFGRERKDHKDMMKPMKSYLMCQALHQDFIAQYGSCRCHDIQNKLMGRSFNLLDPKDLAAAVKSDMMEHCSGVAGRAAARAAELILAQKTAIEK